MRSFYLKLLLAITILRAPALVQADDWPQWRGPLRDGISRETGLLQNWPKDGPPLLWTYRNAGVGYSSPAVVGGRLIMSGGRDRSEWAIAVDTVSGKELWSTELGPLFTFQGNSWGDGPRATPTVDGDLLFVLGGQGELVCIETATGKKRWLINLGTDLGGEITAAADPPTKVGWGFTAAPLVDRDLVICQPGGSKGFLAALERTTGKVIWRSKELKYPATYVAPIIVEVGGVRQCVVVTDTGIAGVEIRTGRLLWNLETRRPMLALATPIAQGTWISVTTPDSYEVVELIPAGVSTRAELRHKGKTLKGSHLGVIRVGSEMYGYSEGTGWTCLEFRTGHVWWRASEDDLEPGSTSFADGHFYYYGAISGLVALIQADAKGWKTIGSFTIPQRSKKLAPQGGAWTHPVIAQSRLYLRDQELLYCFDVKGEQGR